MSLAKYEVFAIAQSMLHAKNACNSHMITACIRGARGVQQILQASYYLHVNGFFNNHW